MNDRYLFRGKSRDTGKWFFGNLSFYGHKAYIDTTPIDGGKYNKIVIPETVGQCTGLKDKNGTLIFEGDIVKCRYGEINFIAKIEFYKSGFYVMNGCQMLALYAAVDVEILGNIHDNPELLEV
jgi:uncharacterized phage protein (TIGR01671 family)